MAVLRLARTFFGLLSCLILAGAVGCASTAWRAESGEPLSASRWRLLKDGRTTQVEAGDLFGKPQEAVVHDDGRAQWVYAWGRARSNEDGALELVVETWSLVFRNGVLEYHQREQHVVDEEPQR
jgi:hypothetical protein